jgi:hypothetical protein
MPRATRPVRLVAIALVPVAMFAAAFAAGRASAGHRVGAAAIQIRAGLPVGVLHTPPGALAAADNYVAAGMTASLDQTRLQEFADALVQPAARGELLRASAQLDRRSAPPPGTRALTTLVGHALRAYTADTARVTTWEVGSYWGPSLAPRQYWALADLVLRWSGGRWWIVSLDERVPGPVPALIAARSGATTAAAWDVGLDGMSAPYYGAGSR